MKAVLLDVSSAVQDSPLFNWLSQKFCLPQSLRYISPLDFSLPLQDSPLFNWLVSLYPAWASMTGEDVYVSAKIAMAELLLSGCTCSSGEPRLAGWLHLLSLGSAEACN